MGWRSLIISQPARLAVKNRQLLLEQDSGEVTLPLEDLSVIVLETQHATLTAALLAELAAHDVTLLTCDACHQPNGVLLPYLPHSRALRVMQKQLALTLPQKKRAWQGIVRQKLLNQATCLDLHRPGEGDFLRVLARRVNSGDSENREATGANYHFATLFGREFTREQDRWINRALNYGYAIQRAAIARSLVCHGFLPAFGLHHKSQLNAFNLADDLIEPLRPLVDGWAVNRIPPDRDDLLPADKAALVQLLYTDVQMTDGNMNVLAAIDAMVHCLGRYCDNGDLAALDWPQLLTTRP